MDGIENVDDVANAGGIENRDGTANVGGFASPDGTANGGGTASAADRPAQTPGAEWYPDPMRRAPLRQMTPAGWSPWLSDGQSVWFDPRPVRRSLAPPDLAAIQFVDEVFLPEARARGLQLPDPGDLRRLLDELAGEAGQRLSPRMAPVDPYAQRGLAPRPDGRVAAQAAAQQAVPARGPASYPAAGVSYPAAGAPTYVPGARPVRPAPALDPAMAARRQARHAWWDHFRASVGSDLGVHGLAYLGVLLLFVGAFGLVAFAFGDVTPSVRPVAELTVALVPFATARLLLRNGAAVVGRSLEVVGGLLVPIMLIASMVDGYPTPPDPHGSALVVALTVACLGWAVVCALWSRRYPESGLRFGVAPATWLAAAMGTIGVARPMPTGQDVALTSSHQMAAMAAALVLTLALARWHPQHRLALPTLVAGVPGLVVVAILAVLSWAADGRPLLPVALTGVLLLAALELLRPRLPGRLVDVVAPMWWGAVALTVAAQVHAGPLAASAAVGFVVLLEAGGRRRGADWALLLPGAGLVVSLIAVWADPWWAVGTLIAAAGWAVLRRVRPYDGADRWLDAAAAILPAAAVIALGAAQSVPVAVMGATALVAVATVPARRPLLRRTESETFWRTWWRWVLPIVAVAALAESVDTGRVVQWQMAGCFAALALVALVGPVSSTERTWSVTILAGAAWVLGCAAGSAPDLLRGGVLAAAALVMVLAGGAAAAPVVLVGHLLGLASIGLSGTGWGLAAAVGAATAGWVVTAVRDGRSPVGWLGDGADPMRYLPWSVVSLGIPLTVALSLDAGAVLRLSDPWAVAVLAGAALAYAVVARLVRPERSAGSERLRAVAAWASFAAGVFGAVLSREEWSAVVGLAALVGAVVLLPRDRRATPMRWIAWLAIAPLAGLLARLTVPWFGSVPGTTAAALTLLAVGGVLAVGAASVDPRAVFAGLDDRRPGLDAPLVIGAVEVGCALVLTFGVVPMPDAGWVTMGVAAVALAIGVLTGAGSLAGGALLVAWVAVLRLFWPELTDRPWVSVVVAAALAVAAQVLHRLVAERRPWCRWDIPLLVVAAPVAVTALVAASDAAAGAAADRGAFVSTYAVVGALVVAVAIRLRRNAVLAEVLGWVGTALVQLAAARAEAGWLALALLALAAAHTGLAVKATGGKRLARQLVGVIAALASWGVALAWFGWPNQQAVDVTAVGAGAVALLAAGVAWSRRIDRSWLLVWGGAAVVVVAAAAVTVSLPGFARSVWVVLGIVCVALAAAVAASPLRLAGLRDLAAVAALSATVMALQVAHTSPATRVIALSAVAAVLAVATLALTRGPWSQAWARATIELGAGAALVAVAIRLGSDATLLVPAVAAVAVQVGAAGVGLRSVGLQMASPVIACGAWLLFVAQVHDRAPEWYTIAIGLALLAVVAVWRHDQRLRQADPATGPVIGLELVGIAFLVVSSLVQAVTVSLLHALVAMGLGVAVAAWGVVTRVRRRVAAGALVVGVAVVLLVAVPLVRMLPAWGGAGVWLLLAGVGLAAVLVATLLERGRTAVRGALGRVNEVTAGWE
jgi:hypothetical protein